MNRYVGQKIKYKKFKHKIHMKSGTLGKKQNLLIMNIKEETQVKNQENIFKKYRMKFP